MLDVAFHRLRNGVKRNLFFQFHCSIFVCFQDVIDFVLSFFLAHVFHELIEPFVIFLASDALK
jgi:hypothetical protein